MTRVLSAQVGAMPHALDLIRKLDPGPADKDPLRADLLSLIQALDTLTRLKVPAKKVDQLCPRELRQEISRRLPQAYDYLEAVRFDWTYHKDAESRAIHAAGVQ
jgi:hypothetical protein